MRDAANVRLLKPGATIGILGGGQLARMLALAAAPLGLRCHVYSPEKNSCAFDVVHAGTCAPYEDESALGRFAGAVDVITYEFENVPAKTAAFLARRKPVLPDPKVLETTQDRLIEKNFISGLKIATAPYASVHSATQLDRGRQSGGPAGRAQDPPARLRRQGPGEDRQRRRCDCSLAIRAKCAGNSRGVHRFRARGVGRGGART